MAATVYVSPNDAVEGADPRWDALGYRPVHEWRNHVPEDVRSIWSTFTREQRAAIVGWADALASAEVWE